MGKNYSKHKEWLHTKKGRASTLLNAYNHKDEKQGRGKGDLTSEWIVENIFSGQKCAHCDETDWTKLGCNRLDNSKPHTMDNVEPCCKKCNDELHSNDILKPIYQYTLDGKLVKKWNCIDECVRETNFAKSSLNRRLRGKWYSDIRGKWYYGNEYKGYIWSSNPL